MDKQWGERKHTEVRRIIFVAKAPDGGKRKARREGW